MKELYSHKVLTSFYLWLDHQLLNKGQAYRNVSSALYSQSDETVPSSHAPFASPYKQWVFDSSVAGAQIPTGIYVNEAFVPRSSDVVLDFNNGRVLLDTSISGSISGNYSVKDLNTYVVDTEEQDLVFEGDFQYNSRWNMFPESGVSPHGYAAPACFIMNTLTDNKPFAFGGHQDTTNKMRVIVATDDLYHLDGCVSLFRDLTNSIIPLLSVSDDPFNEYGDLKSGSYNYETLAAANQGRYLYIDKISATKLTKSNQTKNNPSLKYGIIDFYLSEPRVPKLDL